MVVLFIGPRTKFLVQKLQNETVFPQWKDKSKYVFLPIVRSCIYKDRGFRMIDGIKLKSKHEHVGGHMPA